MGLQRVRRRLRRPFVEELWKPFDAAGQLDEQWPRITESIERLRPIATEALLASPGPPWPEEIEEAFGKILEAQAKRRS